MKTRGFEVVSDYKDKGINLPKRSTKSSAGYDIESAETVELYPKQRKVIPTGLKAYMKEGEYLGVYVRSSTAIKRGLLMTNSVGIIDSDYYNNDSNEGHIHVALYNASEEIVVIQKGERIAQGIFMRYYTTDNDVATGERTGGIGSTGV